MKAKHKLLLFCMLIPLFISCGKNDRQVDRGSTQAIPVKVNKIHLRDISQILEYVGNIKAKDEILIYPKVSGKIIEKVKEDGMNIRKDEAMLYIDRDEVGLKFEKAPVESPIDGVVGRVYVDIGSNVTPQTSVALVVSMDTVKIDLDVPEKYLSKISLGQKANIYIDAYPNEEFSGVVTQISPVLDLGTRTAPVEITVDNPEHRLKSGMFAKVKLIIKTESGVAVVLKEAIMGREPDTYIYTIEHNQAVLRKVTLGIKQGPLYEVKSGLKEGDLVVIMGQQRLKEGSRVAIEEEASN